jgi:hypothetical protein
VVRPYDGRDAIGARVAQISPIGHISQHEAALAAKNCGLLHRRERRGGAIIPASIAATGVHAMAPSVTRALQTIKRYSIHPEQIDHAILAAINVTLCLVSGGNDRVAEGFNRDIAMSGRTFGRSSLNVA